MSEIRPPQLDRAAIRNPALERDHGHDQADEPEPGDRRQQADDAQEAEQEDGRHQCQRSDRSRQCDTLARNPLAGDEAGREGIRQARDRAADHQRERQSEPRGRLGKPEPDECRCNSERKRRPETLAVEPDRLGDDLTDRARLRRERRRRRLAVGALLLASHRREPIGFPLLGTRVTRVPTTPAHRHAKPKTATGVKRAGKKSETR